jgi:cell wall-associated NlpC family hydrolase
MHSAPSRLARLRAARRQRRARTILPTVTFILAAGLLVAGPSTPEADASTAAKLMSRLSRSTVRSKAAYHALSHVGDGYCYGGDGPGCFDCSGLTSHAYAAAGRRIARTSSGQRAQARTISRSRVIPGDLLFYAGHVEMYAGLGYAVAANTKGRPVNIHRVRSSGLLKVGRIR